jgi:RNA polymerase sigma factor (sigma-70 family)
MIQPAACSIWKHALFRLKIATQNKIVWDCNKSPPLPSLVVKESNGRRTLQSALAEEPAIVVPSEFERVFRAHHGLVFRTAYRITGNAADAEDVSQTVFLRLFRREHAAMENEESYLRRAAINAALDVIRSRQSDRTVELTDLAAEPAHDYPQDDPRELRLALGRALAQLKPRPAEVFVLRFLEGFSNAQIARILGISQVLVAVIVFRARQQLRKELSSYRLKGAE